MDSMNQKILGFLREVGSDQEMYSSSIRSLRDFEGRYDLDIMGMLEREWFEEQISRDMTRGYFRQLHEPDENLE